MTTVAPTELDSLVRREHPNPHGVLGAHPTEDGIVIRALRPAARRVTAQLSDGSVDEVELEQIHPGGVFEGTVEGAELPLRYRLEVDYGDAGTFTIDDPYAFEPTIGELDQHLIGEGRHEELYDRLGAHVIELVPTRPSRGPRSRCGRRRRTRSAWSATSTSGTAACIRCGRSARPASGSCSCRASSPVSATSTRSSMPTANCG